MKIKLLTLLALTVIGSSTIKPASATTYMCYALYNDGSGVHVVEGLGGSTVRAVVNAMDNCERITGNRRLCTPVPTTRCDRF